MSTNKKLIANCMQINHKNIYQSHTILTRDLVAKDKIEDAFKTNPAYGHRRLAIELKMNKKKILRVMHEFNLKPPRLWYQKTFITRTEPQFQDRYTNILKDIHIEDYTIGDLWSSDLTYIKFQGSFIYMAIIRDIISGEIVAFNVGNHHDADLVLKTLKEAVIKAGKPPQLFHSDRGREFLSARCIQFLENMLVKISVSDPGSPWQNTWSESFFSRFKMEFGSFNRFETLGELLENIFTYMHYFNTMRIQLKLKMSPVQFKQKYSESVLEKRGT